MDIGIWQTKMVFELPEMAMLMLNFFFYFFFYNFIKYVLNTRLGQRNREVEDRISPE